MNHSHSGGKHSHGCDHKSSACTHHHFEEDDGCQHHREEEERYLRVMSELRAADRVAFAERQRKVASDIFPEEVPNEYPALRNLRESVEQNQKDIPCILNGTSDEESDDESLYWEEDGGGSGGGGGGGEELARWEAARREALRAAAAAAAAARAAGRGALREVSQKEICSIIGKDPNVVVHAYDPESSLCARIDLHLESIARSFLGTKFIKVKIDVGYGFSEKYAVHRLGALLTFKDARNTAKTTTLEQFGSRNFLDEESLSHWLNESGCLFETCAGDNTQNGEQCGEIVVENALLKSFDKTNSSRKSTIGIGHCNIEDHGDEEIEYYACDMPGCKKNFFHKHVHLGTDAGQEKQLGHTSASNWSKSRKGEHQTNEELDDREEICYSSGNCHGATEENTTSSNSQQRLGENLTLIPSEFIVS